MNKIFDFRFAPFIISIFIITIFVSSCTQSGKINDLQVQIDSLKKQAYKPGFGEFMTYVQIHHNKLWFAGQAQNWPLADFEVNEIKEAMQDIQKYETDRKESQTIIIAYPALDSVSMAIQQKNLAQFTRAYDGLTATCNQCHTVVNFPFNVVKIPDTPPFSNQVFDVKAGK